jgi:hypothetical protein
MEQATATVYKLVQYDDPDPASVQVRAHGNFRPGIRKESEIVDLIKLSNPNEIEQEVMDFLSSGSRIVVIQTDMCLPMTRYLFSDTILKLTNISPAYRRVIVREYDNVLYLARRAFWNGKRLPIEFTPEISQKIRDQFEPTTGNVLKHVPRERYRLPLPSTLRSWTETKIEQWQADMQLQELIQKIENMDEPSIRVTHAA